MRSENATETSLKTLLNALVKQWERDLVIIDSITSFVAHASPEQTISFFEECKQYTDNGMTIALIAHSYAFNESMLVRISSMCDAHFKLAIENMGDKLIKTLEVSKVRGAHMSTGNIISFDIEPGWGMRIIPFTKGEGVAWHPYCFPSRLPSRRKTMRTSTSAGSTSCCPCPSKRRASKTSSCSNTFIWCRSMTPASPSTTPK